MATSKAAKLKVAKLKVKPKKSEKAKNKADASKSGQALKEKALKEKAKTKHQMTGPAKLGSQVKTVSSGASGSKVKSVAAAKAAVGGKSSKVKPNKKDAKVKKEEMDLFDDGEVTVSEELLEYEEELEVAVQEDSDETIDRSSSDESSAPEGSSGSAAAPLSPEEEEDVVLTDAEGNRYCRAKDCDQISLVEGYCRYHYLLFWKKIQVRKEILQDGKLEKYVEDLTSRYPDKFLEMLKKDLRTTKDFLAAIAELEIDESAGENEFEEDAQNFIDEVRGLSDTGAVMEDDEF
jgi:hypothetical protein